MKKFHGSNDARPRNPNIKNTPYRLSDGGSVTDDDLSNGAHSAFSLDVASSFSF
uniref:Uncharacterized protein n=1 Tax=Arion vulgaris TaxID=1028688 RepID=A0A0B7BH14_9EUPU